jgi:hypothetical protein
VKAFAVRDKISQLSDFRFNVFYFEITGKHIAHYNIQMDDILIDLHIELFFLELLVDFRNATYNSLFEIFSSKI